MLFVEGDVIFYVHELSVRFLTEDKSETYKAVLQ